MCKELLIWLVRRGGHAVNAAHRQATAKRFGYAMHDAVTSFPSRCL